MLNCDLYEKREIFRIFQALKCSYKFNTYIRNNRTRINKVEKCCEISEINYILLKSIIRDINHKFN